MQTDIVYTEELRKFITPVRQKNEPIKEYRFRLKQSQGAIKSYKKNTSNYIYKHPIDVIRGVFSKLVPYHREKNERSGSLPSC